MNLIEDNFNNNEFNKKSKNPTKIILISMAVVFALIVILLIMIPFMKTETEDTSLKVIFDGEQNAEMKDMLIFDESGTIYIPIRDVAQYFGYESYNGDYTNKSEQTSQCYIESEEEVVMFTANSDKIYKTKPDSTQYEYYYLDEPIVSKDGKLYITSSGVEKAFNSLFTYDEEKNKVTIQTMEYLVEGYKNGIIEYGFSDISTVYDDQKAILKNLSIVKDSKGKYGLFNISTDETLLETKYDKIEYIPTSGQFLVESNSLLGIYSETGKEKVSISYDQITLMDQDMKLYAVKKNGKYGVIDINENAKISIDYDEIGISNISSFEKNNIKNKYILADRVIPVKKDKLWALYDTNGEQLTEFKYDSLGYIASTNKEAENLLVIPDYNVIIVCKDKQYGMVNAYGKELFNGTFFDDVYMTVTSTQTSYYIARNGKKWDAEEQLEKIGVTKNQDSEETEEEDEQEEQTESNQEEQTEEEQEEQTENEEEEQTEDEKEEQTEDEQEEQTEDEQEEQTENE